MIPKLFMNLIWDNNKSFILFKLRIIEPKTYAWIIAISVICFYLFVVDVGEVENLSMISSMAFLSIHSNVVLPCHFIKIYFSCHLFHWRLTHFLKCFCKRSLSVTIHTYWWGLFCVYIWCSCWLHINSWLVWHVLSITSSVNWVISSAFWAYICAFSHRALEFYIHFAVHFIFLLFIK